MIKMSASSTCHHIYCYPKNRRETSRFQPFLVILIFLYSIAQPVFPQDSANKNPGSRLDQVQTLFSEGKYEDALKIMGELEESLGSPEEQVNFFLLKARIFMKLEDRNGCEEAVREIFNRGLYKQVGTDSLEKELQDIFSKVKAEFWFSLRDSETDKDRDREYQNVIQQAKQKPVKKKLVPKLILGSALLGIVAGAILMFSGGDENGTDENLGTLKFENATIWAVDIEIAGIERYVPASGGRLPQNLCYIDLSPGSYVLTVTSTSPYTGEISIYTYNIEIIKGIETYFLFCPL